MDISNFSTWISVATALLAAYCLLRICQRPLRWLILRFIPLETRMKPNGFVIQTRIINLTAIALFLIISALFYAFIPSLADLKKETTEASTLPHIYRPPLPETYEAPPPLAIIPEDIETRPSLNNKPTKQQRENQDRGEFYIQLDAFAVLQNAGKYRDKKQLKTNDQVLIGIQDTDSSPYKVLVGPFTKRQAEMLIVNKKWKGFLRSRTSFDYLLQ